MGAVVPGRMFDPSSSPELSGGHRSPREGTTCIPVASRKGLGSSRVIAPENRGISGVLCGRLVGGPATKRDAGRLV